MWKSINDLRINRISEQIVIDHTFEEFLSISVLISELFLSNYPIMNINVSFWLKENIINIFRPLFLRFFIVGDNIVWYLFFDIFNEIFDSMICRFSLFESLEQIKVLFFFINFFFIRLLIIIWEITKIVIIQII